MALENLPDDIQRRILSRIPCIADRGRMSLVCHAWRGLIRKQRNQFVPLLPRPRPLPWLLLPALFPDGSARAACVLSGCGVHHGLNITPLGARCFGSHDGGWLFLDDGREPRVHKAVHIRSGNVCDLPGELRRRNDPYPHRYRMVIHAAALSSSPEDANYVGAAIVTSWRLPAPGPGALAAVPPRRRCVALWVKDSGVAMDFVPHGDEITALHVEDVLYLHHGGAFLFLTKGEHISVCTPIRLQHALTAQWQAIGFRPRGRLYGQYVVARYLVVSREELLMVVRFSPHPSQPTSKFMVFQVTKREMPDADADANFPVAWYPYTWSELHSLDGRMLFVGHGCSRSYEASQYPGFKDGIYFLDDGEFYDTAMIFGNSNVRRYPCSDNGKWSEGRVQRCFPRSDPSNRSAPVWLLP
ncbi:hypothetical protein BAE44_0014323 [Dichanthelium oligosanthes]|uniref:F-box domain-containing protein n=1 Tax=Dichanthelium oligosanthes TaxID=888268 RepID=A0A1E5VHS4_9POAL|nr:hypothetical protein BAE44_0014323 [Dichanthelium oligosanthes]